MGTNKLKLTMVAALIVFAALALYPAAIKLAGQKGTPKWYPNYFAEAEIPLGLDLKGGIHLVLGVGVDKAVQDKLDRIADEMRARLTEEGKPFNAVKADLVARNVHLDLKEVSDVDWVRKEMFENDFRLVVDESESSGAKVVGQFDEQYLEEVKKNAVDQAIKTIRNRIDQLGLGQVEVKSMGGYRIQVQLPGVEDPEQAKQLIGKTAQLEFKIAADESKFISDMSGLPDTITKESESFQGASGNVQTNYLLAKKRQTLENWLKDKEIPEEIEIAYAKETRRAKTFWRTYTLGKKTVLTGEYIENAIPLNNPENNQPYVSLTFNPQGAKLFDRITQENVKKRMAIVLDGVVDSAPVIRERISGGRAQIELGSLASYEELLKEARTLAIVLQAGSLPAPVRILEERTVGATLGADSMRSGINAAIFGLILVIIFMAIYYAAFGLVAVLALALNVVFVGAILALFKATLTLPGIAGLVLTVGMAVDANVIIFERVREELRLGKTLRSAVDSGYGHAFSAIFDANVTTLIAAVILWQYGSGPIRGFAVTLSAGIVTSMFTAIFVTRMVFEILLAKREVPRLSIGISLPQASRG